MMLLCSFDSSGGPATSSQMNHTRRLILIYKRPALACHVSCPLFLIYIFLSTLWSLCFPGSLTSVNLILTPWIAVRLAAGRWPLKSSPLSDYYSKPLLPSFFLLHTLSACQPRIPFPLPRYWPFRS